MGKRFETSDTRRGGPPGYISGPGGSRDGIRLSSGWGWKPRKNPIRSGMIKLTPPPLEPHCWRSVCSLFQVVLFALLSLIFGCISEIIRFYNPFVEKLSTSLARNALLADCRSRQNNGDAFVMAVVVERSWTSSTTPQ